ncbi:MAG: FHA domain-containing protein [Planctomycetota bacterium]|jgi:pSer/pThr/pTyr-binding forkhead associated (FHA) protein
MQVNLVFLKNDGTISSFPLPSTVTSIGRRQECDFCIPLPVVSRKHCEINMDTGKVTVRDMRSKNGTYLNDVLIEEANIKAGDVLTIGPVKFVFQIDGQPEHFDEYLKPAKPETPPAAATQEEESFDASMEDLSDVDLGQSHATELFDDFGDHNLDLDDMDFDVDT